MQKTTQYVTWSECYSNFDQGFAAICQEILGFPRVDPHHANEQMTGCPQTHFHLSREHIKKKTCISIGFHPPVVKPQCWMAFQVCFITCGEIMSMTVDSRLHSNTWALVSFLSQWAANQILARGPFLAVKSWAKNMVPNTSCPFHLRPMQVLNEPTCKCIWKHISVANFHSEKLKEAASSAWGPWPSQASGSQVEVNHKLK